jgi:TonB family protein
MSRGSEVARRGTPRVHASASGSTPTFAPTWQTWPHRHIPPSRLRRFGGQASLQPPPYRHLRHPTSDLRTWNIPRSPGSLCEEARVVVHRALAGSAVFIAALMPLRDSCSCQAVQRRVRDPAFVRAVERLRPCWVGCDVRPPKRIAYVPPVWPRGRCSSCTDAVVVVECVIDRTGRVAATNVVLSVPGLDQAAVDAVRHWRYEPALLHGAPIAVVLTVAVARAPGGHSARCGFLRVDVPTRVAPDGAAPSAPQARPT